MKSQDEEGVEGYTLEEFHAVLSLMVNLRPEYREFIEKNFANDMTPKERLDYVQNMRGLNRNPFGVRFRV